MRPSYHAVISLGFGALMLVWLKSWPAAAACFLSGIFIDIDHHLDYILVHKKFPSYKELAEFCGLLNDNKFLLLFHAYEWLALIWLSIWWFNLPPVWTGLAVGLTTHLIADQIFNPINPWGYFFTYRFKHGFNRKKLLLKELIMDKI